MELPYKKIEDGKISLLVSEFQEKIEAFSKISNQNLLLKILDDIFNHLEVNYYTNEIEKEFLKELKLESKKLLKLDLDFLNKKKDLELEKDFFLETRITSFSEKLINFLFRLEYNKLKRNVENGKLRREDLSCSRGILIKIAVIILNIEFSLNGVLKKIKKLKGVKLYVRGLAYELSVPNLRWWELGDNSNTPKTTYLHFDESIDSPKAIVYLNKVNLENGPFSIVKNAFNDLEINYLQFIIGRVIGKIGRNNSKIKEKFNHKYHQALGCDYFKTIFNKMPSVLKFNSHFGFDVIIDSDLESTLLKNEIIFTGEAGKTIIFNGSNLLHRGGLVEKGERLALQVVFK